MKTIEAAEEVEAMAGALLGMELGLWLNDIYTFRGRLEYAIREMRGLAGRLESGLDSLEPVDCDYVDGELGDHGLQIPFREAP